MVSWFDSHIYGFLTLHNQSSWFIKDPLSHLSPPLLSCWDPWWWSGCCNQPFAISKSMVADWEVQWENERFHRTSPALLFCRYLEKIDLAKDWRSTSFRRLALYNDFHVGSFSVHNDAKGRHPKKNRFFLGNSPKQRTPPTHPYGLGLR